MSLSCDVIIVGSGISGLSYALHLIKHNSQLKIKIITKSDEDETATKYAQGGIAVVIDQYNQEKQDKHINDTLKTGDGLCDEEVVKIVVKEGANRFKDLVDWGVSFDKKSNGQYDFHMEGGHSSRRIIHHRDITGKVIEDALLTFLASQHKQIEILDHHFALDLLQTTTPTPRCNGIELLDTKTNRISTMKSKLVVLCTGGIGQIYQYTSNPIISTGDGIAMAHLASASISNMAFIQFHPTTYLNPKNGKCFLITEAIRGMNGYLLNERQERFMFNYDSRGELASRDIVSRAIIKEINNDSSVYLSITHLPKKMIKEKFPTVYGYFEKMNLDISKELIPIVPAAHYLCGGIDVNNWGESKSLKNLLAIGECSNTGLHGANRLASNSLLEAVVFSYRAALKSIDLIKEYKDNEILEELKNLENSENLENLENPQVKTQISETEIQTLISIKKELISGMSKNANIERNTIDMLVTIKQFKQLLEKVKGIIEKTLPNELSYEIRNMLIVALLILEDSVYQPRNIGTYYNQSLEKIKYV